MTLEAFNHPLDHASRVGLPKNWVSNVVHRQMTGPYSVAMQLPVSFQISHWPTSWIHRLLPVDPVRLKYLKPQDLLPAPTRLGEHIRQRRLTLKLTLKHAGKLLGTDEQSINNWEKGRKVPRVYWLPAIIRFLGYNPLPEPRTVPERLLMKRLERGWSRTVAARELGIDQSTLRDWEHGKIILFEKHRTLVANFLGIPQSLLDNEMKTRLGNAHGKTGSTAISGTRRGVART
jgi:transcriptional regulator with XRE-family HTH domain